MPTIPVNGVTLYYELRGERGSPLVFVHGGWGDHHNWDRVASVFAREHRVVAYDRRGYSQSERSSQPGTFEDDVDDLAGIIEGLGLAPAHVIGSSSGGAHALSLGLTRPELCRTLVLGEPGALSLVRDDPVALADFERNSGPIEQVNAAIDRGDYEVGARGFVEQMFGPSAWDTLPLAVRQTFVHNAPRASGEWRALLREQFAIEALRSMRVPSLLLKGGRSILWAGRVVDQLAMLLPDAQVAALPDAGHTPHLTHPEEYVRVVSAFIEAHPM